MRQPGIQNRTPESAKLQTLLAWYVHGISLGLVKVVVVKFKGVQLVPLFAQLNGRSQSETPSSQREQAIGCQELCCGMCVCDAF